MKGANLASWKVRGATCNALFEVRRTFGLGGFYVGGTPRMLEMDDGSKLDCWLGPLQKQIGERRQGSAGSIDGYIQGIELRTGPKENPAGKPRHQGKAIDLSYFHERGHREDKCSGHCRLEPGKNKQYKKVQPAHNKQITQIVVCDLMKRSGKSFGRQGKQEKAEG